MKDKATSNFQTNFSKQNLSDNSANTDENNKAATNTTENPNTETASTEIPDDHAVDNTATEISSTDKIAELEEKCDDYKYKMMEAMAEAENVRRRARVDVEKAHKYSQEKLINELLPVIDNLEQAVETIQKTQTGLADNAKQLSMTYMGANEAISKLQKDTTSAFSATIQGIEMTHKLFDDALAKFDVTAINPVDDAFDSNIHEALSMMPSSDVPENNVLSVVQKGYKLADRVIRPAKVIVSKGAA